MGGNGEYVFYNCIDGLFMGFNCILFGFGGGCVIIGFFVNMLVNFGLIVLIFVVFGVVFVLFLFIYNLCCFCCDILLWVSFNWMIDFESYDFISNYIDILFF